MFGCIYKYVICPIWLDNYVGIHMSYMVGFMFGYMLHVLSYMVGHFFLHVHVNHVWLELLVCNLS